MQDDKTSADEDTGVKFCPATKQYQECVRCPMNYCRSMVTFQKEKKVEDIESMPYH